MDTYSGNTKIEVTCSGWLYLANVDLAMAQRATDPLKAADLLGGATQKLILALQSIEPKKRARQSEGVIRALLQSDFTLSNPQNATDVQGLDDECRSSHQHSIIKDAVKSHR